MAIYKSYYPVLYRTMTYGELKNRVEKLYPKLGITTMTQAAGLFGYTPDDQFKCFYRCGVNQRAQVILNLLEAIAEEDFNNLIEGIENNGN